MNANAGFNLISFFSKMFANFAFLLFLTVICLIELANCAENEENGAADLSEAIKYKMDATWAEYKEAFGKTYESGEEEKAHERAFHERKRRIEAQNGAYSRGQQGFRLGFSPLTDWTEKERQQLNGYRRKLFRDGNVNGAGGIMSKFSLDGVDLAKLPASLDWRKGNGTRKLVTPVKNQGRCGSCWAFSTVGALEAAHSKATGALIRLSEQNLLDCDIQEYGCWGGWPRMAMEFTIGEGGLNFETLYPYKGVEQNCSFSKLKPIGASKVRGYTMVGEGDEQALMAAVALNGPISVAIYASETFMEYAAGILDDPICSQVDYLNHAVLLVGYGTDAKWGDYWIVKNSWSDRWGDKGYIKMARNKNNQCGIATEALFATI